MGGLADGGRLNLKEKQLAPFILIWTPTLCQTRQERTLINIII